MRKNEKTESEEVIKQILGALVVSCASEPPMGTEPDNAAAWHATQDGLK